MVKVGLEISSSKLKYDKKPSVNFVFPEPKSPVKTIISLLLQIFAKFLAKFFVSVSLCENFS